MLVLSLSALLICCIATLIYFAYLVETQLNHLPDRIIYYSSNLREQGKILEDTVRRFILDRGEDTVSYHLVEPGAGLGRVAQYLARAFTWKDVQAVEVGPVILTAGRLHAWLHRSRVHFIRQNIFTYSLPPRSFVYCYLSEEMVDRLYQTGQLKGQLVVCLTFTIPTLTPTETIPLPGWQKRLTIYDLREKLEEGNLA